MEELVKQLLAANQELTERVVESNKVLASALIALSKAQPEKADAFEEIEWAAVPLHMSEEEQDAKHMLDTGQIDKAEYEEMLRGIGLEPTIEFFTD